MTSTTRSRSAARQPTAVDERSVGDLLLDADLTARDLLWDTAGELARSRTIGWERVVDAAAGLWAAIPDRSGDPTMSRVRTLAESRNQRHAAWLAETEPDVHLVQVRDNLRRATELVAGRRHPTAPLSEPGHLDSEAARTRIMHTVYVTAHATASAVDSYRRALRWEVGRHGRFPAGESLEAAGQVSDRLRRTEYLAANYLHTRWPNALHGQHHEQPDATRLSTAVAQWRVKAGRALAGEPVATNLVLVARVERELAITTLVITNAATRLGKVHDPDSHLLLAGLGQLQKAWAAVDQDMNPLVDRRTRADPDLLHAAHGLRSATREITHDGAGLATASTMDARTDLASTTHELHRSLPGAWDITQAVRESTQDPDLIVRAGGAYALVCRGRDGLSPTGVVIDAADVVYNRPIPLPDPARTELLSNLDRVAHAATTAAALTLPRPQARAEPSTGTRIDGQTHERRDSMRPPLPAPGHDR